jgi:hypothetical protein
MAVVSSLGERYLWVDVLCIIQDDEKSKALFISQMDIVYHHALLTIVAMSGQDANSGLPGLRPFTSPQQLRKEVDGSVFLTTPPGLRSSASVSRYEQRGWTLQERILSNDASISPQGKPAISADQLSGRNLHLRGNWSALDPCLSLRR